MEWTWRDYQLIYPHISMASGMAMKANDAMMLRASVKKPDTVSTPTAARGLDGYRIYLTNITIPDKRGDRNQPSCGLGTLTNF